MSSIGILIRHPSIDPAHISSTLGLTPTAMARCDDLIVTPTGDKPGGRHKLSWWSYFDEDETKEPSLRARQLLQMISKHKDLFNDIIADGGQAILLVHADSDVHMHCQFEPQELALLSRLSIRLGLEIFPG